MISIQERHFGLVFISSSQIWRHCSLKTFRSPKKVYICSQEASFVTLLPENYPRICPAQVTRMEYRGLK